MAPEPVVRTIIEPDPYTNPKIRVGVVEIAGERLVLTAQEFLIWDALYRRRHGDLLPMSALEERSLLWATAKRRNWRNCASVHLCRLREKLADQGVPFTIQTVPYVGHKLFATQEDLSCSKP